MAHNFLQSSPAAAGDSLPRDPKVLIDRFLDAIWMERGLSENTLGAYRADLVALNQRLTTRDVELARATATEKQSQLDRVRAYQAAHRDEAAAALARLKDTSATGENVFAVLMDAARVCTLGQVTEAFFEVGGQYRRNV